MMSTKVIDDLLSRWFFDGEFRQALRDDPERALAGYDLTPAVRARLFKLKKDRQWTAAARSGHMFSLN